MNFACPTCNITLQAEPDLAGKTVKCPGCSTKIQIPEDFGPPAPDAANEGEAAGGTEEQYFDEMPELEISVAHGDHPSKVNVWIGGGLGIGATLLWFLVMNLIPQPEEDAVQGIGGYLKELFLDRGWPQYVTTLLMFWCLGLLVLKWLNIKKQRSAMLIQTLPTDISEEINHSNLKAFHDHIINFPKPLRNTYIVNRIRKALEFFYVRQNNPEVAQMIASQSEIDAAKVNSSYSMVKVFLWAIPIMGFIGTVLGIGTAIGGFDAVLAGGEGGDMDAIKGPLSDVLGSMGIAFDTTLLALVFSIILSFPASALQNEEDDLVTDVDEYCIDHLLKRLDDGGSATNLGSDAGLLNAIGEAIAENQKSAMTRFESIQKGMSESLKNQTAQYGKVADAVEKQVAAIDMRTEKYEKKLDKSIDGNLGLLSEGIGNLNAVLKELNGKQVVVQKKGWFGRG